MDPGLVGCVRFGLVGRGRARFSTFGWVRLGLVVRLG